MSYNGWTNYETWSVAVHLQNDATAIDTFREIHAERAVVATDIEEFVNGEIDRTAEELHPMADQLLNGALDEVNFSEIATVFESGFASEEA